MSRYLIVAHLTADSPELRVHVEALIARDHLAEFTLLVPATPASYWHAWDELEAHAGAERRAAAARGLLESAGARVLRTAVGAREPLAAIDDELREGGSCDEVIVSTLPAGLSRWLKLDLVAQCRRRYPRLRVTHVTAQPRAEPASAAPNHVRPSPEALPKEAGHGLPGGPEAVPVLAATPGVERRDARAEDGPASASGGPGEKATPPLVTEGEPGVRHFPGVRRGDLSMEARELWDRLDEGNGVATIFRTLGHNPNLLRAYVQMLSALWQDCGLDPLLRELVVLRVAQVRGGRYVWHEHVRIARGLGMADAKIAAIEHWQASEHVRFSARERVVLRHVDATCHGNYTPSHEDLLREFPLAAIVGLNLLIGFYAMSDSFAQAMQVETEETFVGWALY